MIELVPKVVSTTKKHFPEAQLILTLDEDPEIDDEHLVLYVRLKNYNESVTITPQEGSAFYKAEMNCGITHYLVKIICGIMHLMLTRRRAGSVQTYACGEAKRPRRSRKLPPL